MEPPEPGRAERMIVKGWMTEVGKCMIDLAKESGTWIALEEVQKNVIPGDLQKALDGNPGLKKNFLAFPPSSKRGIPGWILNAKRQETRQK